MKPTLFFIKTVFLLLYINRPVNAQQTWTLQACLDEALKNNVLLNQDKLNNENNKVNLEQAKANRYPNLNFSDNQNMAYGRSVNPVNSQYINQNNASNSAALTSSVLLFSGGQNNYRIQQNQYTYDAGNADIEKAKNDLLLNVLSAYLQILYAYEAADISRLQVEATAAQVERAQKYVDAGKFAIGNLYIVQSQLAADKSAQVDAESKLTIAKVALMQLMEMPVAYDFNIERPALAEPALQAANTSTAIYEAAFKTLPEIKSASLKSSSAAAGVKLAKATLWPQLTLNAGLKTGYSSVLSLVSYQTSSQQVPIGYLQSNPTELVIGKVYSTSSQQQDYPFDRQFRDNFSQYIGIGMSVPIFNNFSARNNMQKAKINLEYAQWEEKNTRNQLRKTIEQAYTDQLTAANQYSAAKEQLKSEERAYMDMKTKFDAGVANATDFMIEKNNYNKSLQALLQAKYNYILRIKIIDFYMGRLNTTWQ